jgi:hypothetical protein
VRITCPACGGRGTLAPGAQGKRITCPGCGMKWTPAVEADTDGLTGVAVFEAAPGQDPERWARGWSRAAAVGLLVGFLLPFVIDDWSGDGGTSVWFWDMLAFAEGGMSLVVLLPALLGLATLVILGTIRGRARALAIFWTAAGTLLVGTALCSRSGGWIGPGRMMSSGGSASAVFIMLSLGVTAIASGNHLRKRYPRYDVPRLLTGIAGVVVLLGILIPLSKDGPLLALIFEVGAWSSAWPFPLLLLTTMAYAIVATMSLRRLRDPAPLCASLSVLARVIAIGVPVGTFITTWNASIGGAFLAALKSSLLLLGLLALIAIGLTAWLEHILAEERAAAATDPRVLADLSSRLIRLQAARAHHLLSAEEYERKRRQIIDSAEF